MYLSRLFVDLIACIVQPMHPSFRKQLAKSEKKIYVKTRDLGPISNDSWRPGSQGEKEWEVNLLSLSNEIKILEQGPK